MAATAVTQQSIIVSTFVVVDIYNRSWFGGFVVRGGEMNVGLFSVQRPAAEKKRRFSTRGNRLKSTHQDKLGLMTLKTGRIEAHVAGEGKEV